MQVVKSTANISCEHGSFQLLEVNTFSNEVEQIATSDQLHEEKYFRWWMVIVEESNKVWVGGVPLDVDFVFQHVFFAA